MEGKIDNRLDRQDRLDTILAELAARDPLVRRMADAGARPALREGAPGLAGLLRIVVSQQLSVASARAIWARVEERFTPFDAAAIAILPDDEMRACGLSAPKIRTLRAIATAVAEGALDLANLGTMPADDAHAALVTVKGIGPWTADIYLLFCLRHGDAFPAGDLALQEAARIAAGMEARPNAAELVAMAEAWRPWRGAVAKQLWAYYAIAKGRQGAPLGTKSQP